MRGLSRSREADVLERVREIPEGFVRTYGDVSPGAPRFAGSVLFAADEPDLPWWRVVRASGHPAVDHESRALEHYRAEGTPLLWSRDGTMFRVDLGAARWMP